MTGGGARNILGDTFTKDLTMTKLHFHMPETFQHNSALRTICTVLCALVLLCFGVTPSLASQASPASKAEWTVMVFLNAKNNLECFGLQNFAQMAAVGSNDKVNMLVDFGRPKKHEPNCHENPQLWSGILRYRVTTNMKATIQNSIPAFRRMKGPRADMGSEKTLSEFISWSMKQYPANHYMLVIWNHGQGFRLLLGRPGSARPGTPLTSAAVLSEGRPRVSGGVRSVS